MLDEDEPKIYGLDKIDKSDPVYITEGPFDSTFIRNVIAMCGADCDVSDVGVDDPVWIFDNEPRNVQITRRIERSIEDGSKVVIWPSSIREKDINDMVLAGYNVQEIIDKNTYKGLQQNLNSPLGKRYE